MFCGMAGGNLIIYGSKQDNASTSQGITQMVHPGLRVSPSSLAISPWLLMAIWLYSSSLSPPSIPDCKSYRCCPHQRWANPPALVLVFVIPTMHGSYDDRWLLPPWTNQASNPRLHHPQPVLQGPGTSIKNCGTCVDLPQPVSPGCWRWPCTNTLHT